MGQDVANAELKSHAHGTDPLTGDFEIAAHWGNESIDEVSVITEAERDDLIADAVTSQAAFDVTAAATLSWYPSAWSGLSSAKQLTIEKTCRWACSMWA